MIGSSRPDPDGLVGIEDALIEIIMEATPEELRADLIAAGEDPDALIAGVDALIEKAVQDCGKMRFEAARKELAEGSRTASPKVVPFDRARQEARLNALRASDPALSEKLMLAARKGEGMSDNDREALLSDLAEVEALEREADGE